MSGLESDARRVCDRILSSPGILVSLGLAFFLYASHIDSLTDGPLGQLRANYPNSAIVVFLVREYDKLLGLMLLLPVVYDLRLGTFPTLVLGGLVLVAPPYSLLAYLLLALALALLLVSRHSLTRVILVAVGVTVAMYGFDTVATRILHANSTTPFSCPTGYTQKDTSDLCRKVCEQGWSMALVYASNGTACGTGKSCNNIGVCR